MLGQALRVALRGPLTTPPHSRRGADREAAKRRFHGQHQGGHQNGKRTEMDLKALVGVMTHAERDALMRHLREVQDFSFLYPED